MIDDMDLINKVEALCGPLDEKINEDGVESLTRNQSAVIFAWMANGVVGNGGFRYFYERSDDVHRVIEAFEVLGYPDCAEAFRESLTIYPDDIPQTSWDERSAWYDENESDFDAFLSPLEDVIFALDDDFCRRLIAFAESHPEEFPA